MTVDNMQAIIDAARAGVFAQQIYKNERLQLWYAQGKDGKGEVHAVDVEKEGLTPLVRRGTVVVFDAASLNILMGANASAGNIVIYVDRRADEPSITAVMNDNGSAGPGWGDYRLHLRFRMTPAWQKWRSIDGKMMPQVTFAEFIEDNLTDIADPPGAAMLEIAQYLQATRSVNFRSSIRLSSGAVQFRNEESIEAKVGAGEIAIPAVISLGIPPVQGLAAYKIEARFRYRIQEGKLQLGIKMQRVEDIMAMVVAEVVEQLAPPPGSVIVEGAPPIPGR